MVSIHDSLLTGYAVDGRSRTVLLHTEPHQGGGEAFVDVVFRGVVAYDFEGDCMLNIVFDIREVAPGEIVGDGAAFEALWKQYGWPCGWDSRAETPEEFLNRAGARVFLLDCSYGMGGWIAAVSMETVVIKPA